MVSDKKNPSKSGCPILRHPIKSVSSTWYLHCEMGHSPRRVASGTSSVFTVFQDESQMMFILIVGVGWKHQPDPTSIFLKLLKIQIWWYIPVLVGDFLLFGDGLKPPARFIVGPYISQLLVDVRVARKIRPVTWLVTAWKWPRELSAGIPSGSLPACCGKSTIWTGESWN
jgi:hypothetical protein